MRQPQLLAASVAFVHAAYRLMAGICVFIFGVTAAGRTDLAATAADHHPAKCEQSGTAPVNGGRSYRPSARHAGGYCCWRALAIHSYWGLWCRILPRRYQVIVRQPRPWRSTATRAVADLNVLRLLAVMDFSRSAKRPSSAGATAPSSARYRLSRIPRAARLFSFARQFPTVRVADISQTRVQHILWRGESELESCPVSEGRNDGFSRGMKMWETRRISLRNNSAARRAGLYRVRRHDEPSAARHPCHCRSPPMRAVDPAQAIISLFCRMHRWFMPRAAFPGPAPGIDEESALQLPCSIASRHRLIPRALGRGVEVSWRGRCRGLA